MNEAEVARRVRSQCHNGECVTCMVLQGELIAEAVDRELASARQQLCWAWETFKSCACGARRNSLSTHPHVIGCPTEKAWELAHAGSARIGGDG